MSFLDAVCDAARERVAAAAEREPLDALRARASACPPPPSLAVALTQPDVAVIAEIKRSSPSRGALAPIPDPAALAGAYHAGGAAAVSVLTEPLHFSGSLEDLANVAAAVPLPVLRKDFVVDAYQVWEARAAGAAAVLLIVAALEARVLQRLLVATAAAGLDALLEVHDVEEVDTAVAAYARADADLPLIVGVNARDLRTLEVDRDRFGSVAAKLPSGAITVAESGVAGPDDVARLAALGAAAVLVGEHVATADDPRAAVAALVAAGRRREGRA